MFAVHEVTVEARFEDAAAFLTRLVNHGTLRGPSEAAYEDGIAVVLRVGPFGGKRGLSKLVRVRLMEAAHRDGALTFALRWDATGVTGELFPVLDADLTLTRDGDSRSRLALVGAYRPPFGPAGAAVDRAIMHSIAVTTVRSLLTETADAMAHPHIPHPDAIGPASRWERAAEPETR